MRLKLIIGIILCLVALIGVIVSYYAWSMTSEAKNDYIKKNKEIENKGINERSDNLLKEKDEALDKWETNQRAASLVSIVSVIFVVLGAILIVIDVLKVKISKEERIDRESKERVLEEETIE